MNNKFDRTNIIVIFFKYNWFSIIFLFKAINIAVSAGSNTKRHILSFLQYNLAKFIIAFENNHSVKGVKFFLCL
jgi:hypothetical protein